MVESYCADAKEGSQPQEPEEWLKALQQTDQTFYNLMSMELWSLARTMDEMQPGFWGQYMRNRQAIVRQQIQARQQRVKLAQLAASASPTLRKSSPFGISTPSTQEQATAIDSLFSEAIEPEVELLKGSEQPVEEPKRSPVSVHLTELPEISQVIGESGRSGVSSPPTPEPRSTIAQILEATAIDPTLPISLVSLPHLIHPPVIKVLPTRADAIDTEGLLVTIACWLTRHFQVPALQRGVDSLAPKRLSTIIVEPGQFIVCELGFRLSDFCLPVSVQLVKQLRNQGGVTAEWITNAPHALILLAEQKQEVAVRLTNHSTSPHQLQAGQTFCRLEFRCSSVPSRKS